jgi:hypothetical protein
MRGAGEGDHKRESHTDGVPAAPSPVLGFTVRDFTCEFTIGGSTREAKPARLSEYTTISSPTPGHFLSSFFAVWTSA